MLLERTVIGLGLKRMGRATFDDDDDLQSYFCSELYPWLSELLG